MDKIYLQQFIAQNSHFSRRKAEDLIRAEKVKVNGRLGELGQKIDSDKDQIMIWEDKKSTGNIIKKLTDKKVYYLVNKPVGYTCTTADRHAIKKVTDLVPTLPKVYPVGRLDKNTSGLIILTNDGDFAYKLTHPKFEVEKEYVVQIVPRGTICAIQDVKELQDQLLKGVKLEDGLAKMDKVHEIRQISPNSYKLNCVLHSGKKRVIRRIFEALGWKVVSLERIRIGTVKQNVPRGTFIELSHPPLIQSSSPSSGHFYQN